MWFLYRIIYIIYNNFYMSPTSNKKMIENYIRIERNSWLTEQTIYEDIVSQWYDRETIVWLLSSIPHPQDIKNTKLYNRILIVLLILQSILVIWFSKNGPWLFLLDIIFIFFISRYSIGAYYWLLFCAILGMGDAIIMALYMGFQDGISFIVILLWVVAISILILPFVIIHKLLPHKDGKGISIRSNWVHVFPEK